AVGKCHREAARVRCCNELLGIGARALFETRGEAEGPRVCALGDRHRAFAGLEVAFPLCSRSANCHDFLQAKCLAIEPAGGKSQRAPARRFESAHFFGFAVSRRIVTFSILVGLTERSPRTSTLASLSIISSGPHWPKMV